MTCDELGSGISEACQPHRLMAVTKTTISTKRPLQG